MQLVLFLDDDVVDGQGVLEAGRNRLEDHYEYFVKRGVDALLFDGRRLDTEGGIVEIADPRECADEIIRRLRIDIRMSQLAKISPHVVLDIEWFGDMEYGKTLLEELHRTIPSGGIGRVVVCSKWADERMRQEFVRRFEILRPLTLDKTTTAPELLWQRIFDEGAAGPMLGVDG